VEQEAAPVEPAPVAQPAEQQGASRSARMDQDKDTGIRTEHVRLMIFLCGDTVGEPRSAQLRCTHVRPRGLLSSRARRRGSCHEATLAAQERAERMGRQSLHCH
jgi:hypothetical protein